MGAEKSMIFQHAYKIINDLSSRDIDPENKYKNN